MAGIILNRNRQVPAEETPAFGGIAERFRRAGDLDRAIALCREGLKRFPDQLSARVTLGWSFLDKGQYDAARLELEQVLRRAPDNLAAIRGLAELHDRTEGALPPEEDERSWRSDAQVGSEVADVRPLESGPEPEPTTAAKTDAPLHVTLGYRAPEILHTAAHAEMAAEAAASVHVPLSLDVAPVELEGLADASMAAAANEPAQFFVVDPTENFSLGAETSVDTAPAPFEVLGPNDREASELADVASLLGHGLDDDGDAPAPAVTFDAGLVDPIGVSDAGPITTGTVDDDATLEDWAALAALSAEADAAAEAATAPVRDDRGADAVLELAATEANALEDLLVLDAPQIAVSESLDDIDELAGQDIADAIKALEDAARRVEARFAVRPALDAPVATSEEIAAFDFGHIADVEPAVAPEAAVAAVDATYEGSFELVAPDLGNLAFSDSVGSEDAVESDELAATPAALEPAFDFERAPEVADAAPDTNDVDMQAGQSVAVDESAESNFGQTAETDVDLVAHDQVDAEADILFTSIEASITGPVDVDDVIGRLSIATGPSWSDADSTPVDVLGGMALHPTFDTTEAVAGLAVGYTHSDHVTDEVAGVPEETAEGAVSEDGADAAAEEAADVVEDVLGAAEAAHEIAAVVVDPAEVEEVADEVAEVAEDEVWTAEAAIAIVSTDVGEEAEAGAGAGAEVEVEADAEAEQSQLAPESAEAVAEILESGDLEELLEAIAPDDVTSDKVADALHSLEVADSGDDESRNAASEADEPAAASVGKPGLGTAAALETGADPAEPSSEPRADVESEVESESFDSDSDSDDLPLAALVATEVPGPASWPEADAVVAASSPWLEPDVVAVAPVTAVYDAPVFSSLTRIATAEVAALAGPFGRDASVTGHVGTSTRSTLHRLERFLRQVQARQLELRGETVA